MTLANCSSVEDFPYNFDEWLHNCGFVALTPSQLSGALASPNIRGNVVVQGQIYVQNLMGCPGNVDTADHNLSGADAVDASVYPADQKCPKYRCMVSGIYSNRAIVLDAKSGLMTEATYSQAFQQQLDLGACGSA